MPPSGERNVLPGAAEYELSLDSVRITPMIIPPYGEWYGMNGQPWCAMFVSWCAWQAGVFGRRNLPKYAYCPYGKKLVCRTQSLYASKYRLYSPNVVILFSSGMAERFLLTGIVGEAVQIWSSPSLKVMPAAWSKKSMYDLTNTYIDGYGIFKKGPYLH